MKAPRECRNVGRKLCIDSEKFVRQYFIVRTVKRQHGPSGVFERDGGRSCSHRADNVELRVLCNGVNTLRSFTSDSA